VEVYEWQMGAGVGGGQAKAELSNSEFSVVGDGDGRWESKGD